MIAIFYFVVIIIGYLLGSIPFGVIISRRSTKTDITQVGSGKTGMTNVLRTAGKKAAGLALVLDIGKGILAAAIAGYIFGTGYVGSLTADSLWTLHNAQALAAMAAIGGHSWSVFLKFKGGRGVNTFLGGLLAMCWPVAIVGGGLMIIIGALSRYMSLGSITGAVAAFIILIPLNIMDIYPAQCLFYAMIGAIFIIVMHRDNIRRLISGTERKLGEKTQTETSPSSGNPE
jgi:glycerol-3-phosphate acyltransferase PlsY